MAGSEKTRKKCLHSDSLEGWDEEERWEGGLRGRGYMFTYGRFTLLYGRNQHSIVKQLSSS